MVNIVVCDLRQRPESLRPIGSATFGATLHPVTGLQNPWERRSKKKIMDGRKKKKKRRILEKKSSETEKRGLGMLILFFNYGFNLGASGRSAPWTPAKGFGL